MNNSSYECTVPEIEIKFKTGAVKKVKIKDTKDAVSLIKENFFNQDTLELFESVVVLFLNRNCMSIGWMRHSIGGIAQSVIDVNLIVATALKSRASGVIIAHNHPGGSLEPSFEDIFITNRLKFGLMYFDIKLIDHLIITEEDFLSIMEEIEKKEEDKKNKHETSKEEQ